MEKGLPVILPKKIEKDSNKPIAFRADPDTVSKIYTLEKTRDESRSEIIKNAINESYEKLISKTINSHIFNYMNEYFGKMRVNTFNITVGGITDFLPKEEGEVINPFERSDSEAEKTNLIIYTAKENPSFKSKDEKKKLRGTLKQIRVEITNEANNYVRLKIIQASIMVGSIKDFDAQLYLSINNSAIENNLKSETENTSEKGNVALNVFFEQTYPIPAMNQWIKEVKNAIKSMAKFDKSVEKTVKRSKSLEIKKISSEQPSVKRDVE